MAGRIEDYAIVGDMQSATWDSCPRMTPKVVSTIKVRQRDLVQDGFLRRYELSGRHEEAIELFERLRRSVPG